MGGRKGLGRSLSQADNAPTPPGIERAAVRRVGSASLASWSMRTGGLADEKQQFEVNAYSTPHQQQERYQQLQPPYPFPPPLPPPVAHGCLLIPAVFAVWWFWTKNAARKACRRASQLSLRLLHPSQPHSNGDARRSSLPSHSNPLACGAGLACGDNDTCSSSVNAVATHGDLHGQVEAVPVWDQVFVHPEYRPGGRVDPTNAQPLDAAPLSSSSSQRRVRWMHGPDELHLAAAQFRRRPQQPRPLEAAHPREDSGPDRMRHRPPAPTTLWLPFATTHLSHNNTAASEALDPQADDDDPNWHGGGHWQYIPDLADLDLCSMASGLPEDDDKNCGIEGDNIETNHRHPPRNNGTTPPTATTHYRQFV